MNPPSSAEILRLWQASLPVQLPHERGLRARLGDPAELLWRRDTAGRLVALAAARAPEGHPYAYLRLLLVHPAQQRRGLGRALVQEVRERLGSVVGPVANPVPLALGEERGHFFPGAPAQSVPFWQACGFRLTGAVPCDMRRDLRASLPPPALPGGLRLTDGTEPGVLGGVLRLTQEAFSPRWTADAVAVGRFSPAQVLALRTEEGTVVGFALTGHEDDPLILPSFLYPAALRRGFPDTARVGGLGPVGLHPNWRGAGLGRAFMLAAMHHLKGRGVAVMGIDWTGIAPFYEKLGFRSWQSYRQMRG